jgi:hypothetical protein
LGSKRIHKRYIVLKYKESIYLTELNIYETFHGGAITSIKVKNDKTNKLVTIWKAKNNKPQDISQSRIFKPPIQKIFFKIQEVRLELDCSFASSYCEIDAVGK